MIIQETYISPNGLIFTFPINEYNLYNELSCYGCEYCIECESDVTYERYFCDITLEDVGSTVLYGNEHGSVGYECPFYEE